MAESRRLVPVETPVGLHELLPLVGGIYDGQYVPDVGMAAGVWDGTDPSTFASYHRFLVAPLDGTPGTYSRAYVLVGLDLQDAERRLKLHLTRPGAPRPAELTKASSPRRRFVPHA